MQRHGSEIMQRRHAFDYGSQGEGDFGIGRIRIMSFAIHDVSVDGRMKSRFHLRGRAAENQLTASIGHRFHLEAVAFEPAGHLAEITIGNTEQFAKVFRREPAVILRRSRILLSLEQSFQRELAAGVRLKDQNHAVHAMIGRCDA
jgi:hypothetical protein